MPWIAVPRGVYPRFSGGLSPASSSCRLALPLPCASALMRKAILISAPIPSASPAPAGCAPDPAHATPDPRYGKRVRGTEEQTTARGTEETNLSLFLWLFSAPLYLQCSFAGFGMIMILMRVFCRTRRSSHQPVVRDFRRPEARAEGAATDAHQVWVVLAPAALRGGWMLLKKFLMAAVRETSRGGNPMIPPTADESRRTRERTRRNPLRVLSLFTSALRGMLSPRLTKS
jgi:hypothetical protein